MNHISVLSLSISVTLGDEYRLLASQSDWGVTKGFFRCKTQLVIMRSRGDRASGLYFGRRSELVELEFADGFGPRAARIVGEPESVGGEYEVIAEDWHWLFSRCARQAAALL
ncbi:MAG: hypothetical protein SH868_16380 [Bythopirellula sp.]|nr:hypothetical protein [Bythopirellula sp.]